MVRFRIRRATLRDIPVLVEQRRRMFDAFRKISDAEHEIGDREYRKWVRRWMKKKELFAWIAEKVNDSRPVAGGAVWLIPHQPRPGTPAGNTPYLLSMYTDPGFRGLGLASRIVREAMRWSRVNGYTRMTLHASKFGRSVYRKLGWERTWEMRVDLSRREGSRKRLGRRRTYKAK
ncbi:MAG TPA: GNAT family N-acetyltransferase [Thermoplasmata archaeon]|nr:GNAT family N-acetyltransferase [Thermoplasmata archaeon]